MHPARVALDRIQRIGRHQLDELTDVVGEAPAATQRMHHRAAQHLPYRHSIDQCSIQRDAEELAAESMRDAAPVKIVAGTERAARLIEQLIAAFTGKQGRRIALPSELELLTAVLQIVSIDG